VQEDGTLTLNTAQDGGRVEVLSGTMKVTDGILIMEFNSLLFGNDERMVKTKRVYTIEGGGLAYSMSMQTGNTAMTQHLAAVLSKAGDIPALIM